MIDRHSLQFRLAWRVAAVLALACTAVVVGFGYYASNLGGRYADQSFDCVIYHFLVDVGWTLPIIVALAAVRLVVLTKQVMHFPPRTMTLDTWLNRDDPHDLGYPTKAAAFVEQNITQRTHKLINEFTWGGYLAWRLGDRYQVLLDGRTQLYPAQFWRDLYLSDAETRRNTLSKFDADAAVVPAKKSRFADPLKSLGWTSIYRDERAEVLIKASPKTAQ